jgi:hypothetical protein
MEPAYKGREKPSATVREAAGQGAAMEPAYKGREKVTGYYSSGLLHDGPPFFRRWSCEAGGLELGVVVVPSGAGLVASPPS